ncbi:MAG TPA: hypothetical protein VHH73_09655, partial [Verrucomicrobiae bacterium]|nr:hypothetical protein [Verrucomicrobiae bacterium]
MLSPQMMAEPSVNRTSSVFLRVVARQILVFLVLTVVMASTLNALGNMSRNSAEPAGLGRGILDGALMPLAMPALLTGNDVPIYAANNSGRTYKLGYTAGV